MKQNLVIMALMGIGSALYVPLPLVNRLSSVIRRETGDCHDFPRGAAPLPGQDTPESFADFSVYSYMADVADTPAQYTKSFGDYNSSVTSPAYLGVFLLDEYNTHRCAAYCDERAECVAFNIYISRDPSKDPGIDCPNPPSTANIKCTLFSSSISAELATNAGQLQPPADALGKEFKVLIRASNGYNHLRKQFDSQNLYAEGFIGPSQLAGAINLSEPGIPEHISTQVIRNTLDAKLCARECDLFPECKYFNIYELEIDPAHKIEGNFFCSLFTGRIAAASASVTFIADINANSYHVVNSYGFSRPMQQVAMPPGSALQKRARLTTLVTTRLVTATATSSIFVDPPTRTGKARKTTTIYIDPQVKTGRHSKTTTSTMRVHLTTIYQVSPTTISLVSTEYVEHTVPTTVIHTVPTTVLELAPTTVTDRTCPTITKASSIVIAETRRTTITTATPVLVPTTVLVLSPTTVRETQTETVHDTVTTTFIEPVATTVTVPTTTTVTTRPSVMVFTTTRLVLHSGTPIAA